MKKDINLKFKVDLASLEHIGFANEICHMMEDAAKKRGTGIAKRDPNYIQQKILEGKAIIALELISNTVAGFCYIETWENKDYVANSGLIVIEQFRHYGLATQIKQKAFELTRKKYPKSKLFGITTSLAVMKINTDLGYKPVTFSELTTDDTFWAGCKSCVNFDVLTRTERKMCLCTGMMYDPKEEKKKGYEEIIKVQKKVPSKVKEPKSKRIKISVPKVLRKKEQKKNDDKE